MTIIQPNRYEDMKRLVTFLGVALIGVLLVMVVLYIQTVDLRHDLDRKRNALEEIKVQNADLKNSFYGLTDTGNLERLAGELGLVQDKNPQWAFASPR